MLTSAPYPRYLIHKYPPILLNFLVSLALKDHTNQDIETNRYQNHNDKLGSQGLTLNLPHPFLLHNFGPIDWGYIVQEYFPIHVILLIHY